MPTLHLRVYYGIVGKVKFIFQITQIKRKKIFTKTLINKAFKNYPPLQDSAYPLIMQQTCCTFPFSIYKGG